MSEIENMEGAIIHGVLYEQLFLERVLPHIKAEYFQSAEYKLIFNSIKDHIDKYNKAPSSEAIIINLQNNTSISATNYDNCSSIVHEISSKAMVPVELEWLTDGTEKWCQDSAFYNVLIEAAAVIDDKKSNVTKFGMPEKMSDALSISFDTSIGHNYFEDAESRFESWHEKQNRLPFSIDMLNRITKGGLPPKTLSILMSSKSGGFKSGVMCSMSADYLMDNKNVLYITCELAEEVVAERIDANLLQVDLDDLRLMSKDNYIKAVTNNQKKTKGKLVVKEYPPASANAGHFRFLIKELNSKHGFVPDIIFIDYVNICTSSRLPPSAASNSYLYIKSIAEELRGLAVEFELPIVSATQAGRQAISSGDLGLEDVSECLDPNSIVVSESLGNIKIKDVNVGDRILSNSGFKTVINTHHPKTKKTYKVKLKSGKEIICSGDHVFPTKLGRKSINTGLVISDKINSTDS